MQAEAILQGLPAGLLPWRVQVFPSLDSTNTFAKALAAGGEGEGCVVVAEAQTAGRGRMGRHFFSPGESGAYFSLLLRPKLEPAEAVLLTTAAAVAVSETLEALTCCECAIKWVNDVYVRGRKVCGILAEAALIPGQARLDYVVLGIGVNLSPPEGGFPEELRPIAASVLETAGEAPVLREALISGVLGRFAALYRALPQRLALEGYRRRCFVIGQRVQVVRGGLSRPALVLALDDDFHLCVRYEDDGSAEALSSGELSIRPL